MDAQGRTEANIRGLSLEQGKRYVVWVMATNGVGRASIGRSDPIIVDAIPPNPPQITAFQQTSADGHANSLSFTFTPGTDDVSGISGHSFAVGSSDKDQKVWPWTVAQGTSATIVNLPLSKGQQVTLQVKSVSGAGLESVATKTFTISYPGAKPPVPPTVLTNPQNFTSSTTELDLTWSPASDPDSGIVAYEYGVGTSPSKADVLGWTTATGSSTPYLLGQGPQGGQGGPALKASALGQPEGQGHLLRARAGHERRRGSPPSARRPPSWSSISAAHRNPHGPGAKPRDGPARRERQREGPGVGGCPLPRKGLAGERTGFRGGR